MTCDHEWFEGKCVHCRIPAEFHRTTKVLPEIEQGGYTFYVDGKFIRTDALESLYKMLFRIEVQLSDRQDRVIRRLLDEARVVLKKAENS